MAKLTTALLPVVVVIGPSGSGKSTAVRALARRGLVRVHPTWTTRPRRADEHGDCLEHRFVSDAEFDRLARCGFFADTVRPFGLPYRYGLPPVRPTGTGAVDLVMLRAPLVERFEALVDSPDVRPVVYQIEDSAGAGKERLLQRGTGAADVAARLRDNELERAAGRRVAHRVFVNDGPLTALVEAMTAALLLDAGVRS